MEPVKSLLVFLLILLACSKSSSQINFSTNWGSGKRSGSMFGQRESDVTCFAKLEYNLLKNLVDIIQSLMKKDTTLESLITSSFSGVKVGVWTWLGTQMATSEFLSNSLDFDAYRKNMIIDSHGAVLIATKRELTLNKHTQKQSMKRIHPGVESIKHQMYSVV